MEQYAAVLRRHIEAEADRTGVPACANQVGSVVQVFAGTRGVARLQDVGRADRDATLAFAGGLLSAGVQIIPRGLIYVSPVHTDADLAATKAAVSQAFEQMA